MTAPGAFDALQAYVPRLVAERVASSAHRTGSHRTESRAAAALWIDVSGFTPLTARLSQQGPRGAELMTEVLNRCFAELGDRIAARGGDLIDFAGDAILALWPVDTDDDLAAATVQAAACALEIQSEIEAFDAADGEVLRFYAGVGAGRVTLMHAGGVGGRWKFIAAGAPLVQVAQAMRSCDVGDVIVSPEAWTLLPGAHGETLPDGFVRLTALWGQPAPPGESPAPDLAGVTQELRAYVLDSVLAKVDAGQRDWLAELRTVSVLFLTVPDADPGDDATRERFLTALTDVQRAVDALDGTLHQVMMDDTGIVFLIAFGLPGHTHEGDSRRAVQTALELRAALATHGFTPRAGVATGKVFCGSYGSASRKRYAMVGSVVNLAARLAGAASDGVLCDQSTRDAAAARIEFTDAPALTLKGIAEPVPVFVAVGTRSATRASGRAAAIMTGRQRERDAIAECVRRAATDGVGALILIEGEAGLGKSLLLAQVLADAPQQGFSPLLGESDAVEANTTYFAWRPVFSQMLGLAQSPDAQARQAIVLAAVRAAGAREDFAPLVNAVAPVGFEESALTRGMSASDRGDATRSLLLDLLAHHAGSRPLLVLDDLHWFDSASLQLLLGLRERVPRALVIVASRTIETDAPAARAILEANGLVRLVLAQMSAAEVGELVRHSLNVAAVPDALTALLVARGEGHPLFTEELTRLLTELRIVRVEGGVATFDANDARLSGLEFPNRIEALLASRIDQLEPSRQLALKVASVVGRTFEHSMVREIHPLENDRPRLKEFLGDLAQASLVNEETPDPRLTFIFRHVLIREVAYGLVAFAQRRELHLKAAHAIEALPNQDREALNPLLAHHYLLGEDFARAIDYLELAGTEALNRGAAREALYFLGEALALADKHEASLGAGASAIRRAEFRRLMGEAAHQTLDIPASRGHFNDALARIGFPVPSTDAAQRADLRSNALVQLGHLTVPSWLRRAPEPATKARLSMAAAIYGTLAEQGYYIGRPTEYLLYSLKSVNYAEAARDTVSADRSYATLAHVMGTMRLNPLLRRYRARAETTTIGRNLAFLDLEESARHIGRGRWDDAIAGGKSAAAKSQLYADRHGTCLGWGCVASAGLLAGRFDEASRAAEEIGRTGRMVYALAVRASIAHVTGEPAGALAEYSALTDVETAMNVGLLINRAVLAAERGDWREAFARANEALPVTEALGLPIPFQLTHISNLPDVYIGCVRHGACDGPREREAILKNARRAVAVLRLFSRVYPIGKPRHLRIAGAMTALDGHISRAQQLCRRSRAEAERLGMWPDVVMADIELARLGAGAHHLAAAESFSVKHGYARMLKIINEVPPRS